MYKSVTTSVLVIMVALLGLATTVGVSAAKPIIPVFVLNNIDWTSASVGGVGNGPATIVLSGVTGPVKRATLYWMGIDNFGPYGPATLPGPAGSQGGKEELLLERTQVPTACDGVYGAATIMFNGNPITGGSTGDATTNCWGGGSSRGYRADVTAYVAGDGSYTLSGLKADECDNVNGASLIVTYDDGVTTNNRDLVFFEGNDSNFSAGFPGETDGWHAVLPGITYRTGSVFVDLFLGDGQTFLSAGLDDNSLTFTAGGPSVVVPDGTCIYDGCSTPNAGLGRASNGSLWDANSADITGCFTVPATYTLAMDGQDPFYDCTGLILAIIDLQAGAAPVPVSPTSWGKVKATYHR